MAPDAVVFDLDYTLAVAERDRQTLLDEAAAAVGTSPIGRDEYHDVHLANHSHETRAPIFAELIEGSETDADRVATAYREGIAASLRPVDGAEAMIEELREEYRVALLTNGPSVAQRDKLATLGWEGLFDAAIVTGEIGTGKPDRRAFEAICEAVSVSPTDAVYVGDEVGTDVHGASGAGMYAIQVLYPGGPKPDATATAHVERSHLPTDLPPVVRRIS